MGLKITTLSQEPVNHVPGDFQFKRIHEWYHYKEELFVKQCTCMQFYFSILSFQRDTLRLFLY